MNLVIENCDFFEESLFEVIQAVKKLATKEDRNHDENKQIKNILDDLDNFNITLILEDVDMIIYTMLLSIRNISVDIIENYENLSFKEIDFPDEKFKQDYLRLLTQCNDIRNILKTEYNMNEKEVEYLDPNSKLVSLRISMSVKGLFYFINTCAKYDELIDINVLFSKHDALYENMVTVALSLTDILIVDDLFIRMQLDNENRDMLLSNDRIVIISNEEYIKYCIQEYHNYVKLSVMGGCSLVAYREILNSIPKQDIKIENFYDQLNQENFGISLPRVYADVNEDHLNLINGYIYDWYILISELKKYEDYDIEGFLCCLNCFMYIFKMNTPIYNYFEIMGSDVTEVDDLLKITQDKLLL